MEGKGMKEKDVNKKLQKNLKNPNLARIEA